MPSCAPDDDSSGIQVRSISPFYKRHTSCEIFATLATQAAHCSVIVLIMKGCGAAATLILSSQCMNVDVDR
jgi:hypothetical protein